MKYDLPTSSELAAHGAHDHEAALNYALSLPGVATAVVGMYTEAELIQNLEWARSHTPLSAEAEAGLEDLGREIAADWGAHYGPVK